jgi:hypothetical protein
MVVCPNLEFGSVEHVVLDSSPVLGQVLVQVQQVVVQVVVAVLDHLKVHHDVVTWTETLVSQHLEGHLTFCDQHQIVVLEKVIFGFF